TDVDTAGSTKMQFFDVFDVLITEQSVPAQSGTATLSFLGLTIPNRPIRRVRIISGNAPLGGNDNPPANDLVVMDDFIYSEPVPAVIPSLGPNPTDDSSFFVRQHYLDFLNREPDTPGFNFWVNQIESCGVDAACREVRRINVSASFFLSIEFQNTGLEAYLTHRAAFGPSAFGSPAPVLLGTFEPDTQALPKDFIFCHPGPDRHPK